MDTPDDIIIHDVSTEKTFLVILKLKLKSLTHGNYYGNFYTVNVCDLLTSKHFFKNFVFL